MKAKIVIMPDGTVSVLIEEGTFETGKVKIEQLLAGLQAAGINLDLIGQVEQHRHDDPGHLARHEALHHSHSH